MENDNSYNRAFNKEDFVIAIKPMMDLENKWTGQVAVDITSSEKNPLNSTDYNHLFYLCKMMCSIVPLMEEDEKLVSRLDAYVKEYDIAKPEDDKLVVTDVNDNIIKLDWISKTKGRA